MGSQRVRHDLAIEHSSVYIQRSLVGYTPWGGRVGHDSTANTFTSMYIYKMESVQFSRSVASDSFQPHGLQHHQAYLSVTISQSLLKLMSIASVMSSNHHIPCHPLLLPPSIFLSIRVFSNESVLCIRWPNYCSFSFSISPSNEYSGLTSLRMDWLDLLAVQGSLKSLLKLHTSKASILQC